VEGGEAEWRVEEVVRKTAEGGGGRKIGEVRILAIRATKVDLVDAQRSAATVFLPRAGKQSGRSGSLNVISMLSLTRM
jgi:hypothetical protein